VVPDSHFGVDGDLRRYEVLLQLTDLVVRHYDAGELLSRTAECLREVFRLEIAGFSLHDPTKNILRFQVWEGGRVDEPTELPIEDTTAGWVWQNQRPLVFPDVQQEDRFLTCLSVFKKKGIRSFCVLPVTTKQRRIGTLALGSIQGDGYGENDMQLLHGVADLVALALENAEAHREIAELTRRQKAEKFYLQDEIHATFDFGEIVGESPTLKRVLAQVQTVAPSDATVLILGETGTGKELIARAIHRMSSRKEGSFIKLNCAAIPTGLLESELFGHEKGAFTGAISQKIGRLELADKGTLFLDEVGDIPLELQPKLLRVLQDQEFERLGGIRTIKVNLRLIAATNKDLSQSVAAREFRSDLFYRIHVFPVRMPALRDRASDISLLVRYFVQRFARRMNKPIEAIPAEAMRALESWQWPGNVRELENFIERCVIVSDGAVLKVPMAELKAEHQGPHPDSTLESVEREYILRVLRETGGVIAGVQGAAARLGMKRTTLQSRIQKMGITRDEYQN